MVPDKKYYKLLHEKGGLGSDTVIVSSDTFRGKPYLTIDFPTAPNINNSLSI